MGHLGLEVSDGPDEGSPSLIPGARVMGDRAGGLQDSLPASLGAVCPHTYRVAASLTWGASVPAA